MKKKAVIWLCAGLCGAFLAGALVYDGLFAKAEAETNGFAMGSGVSISVTAKRKEAQRLADAGLDAVSALDSKISANIEDSSISRINNGETVSDPQTLEYIRHCAALCEQTGGAFDITVGALSRLWDFDDGLNIIPSEASLTEALQTVGLDKIDLTWEWIRIPQGTLLDLGAAGKGLACDKAMKALRAMGADSGVVTVGGSVGVFGREVSVGIRDPFGETSDSFAVLRYSGAVASTSGVYEKHFEADGVNYHHILDPATGWPVQNDLVSVTVVCADGLASDALATACFKLGYEGSAPALDAYNAMAVFVYRNKTVKIYNERYHFELTDQSYEK